MVEWTVERAMEFTIFIAVRTQLYCVAINMLQSKVGISNPLFFRVMGAKGEQIHQISTCLPEQNQLIQRKYHSG